MFEWCQSCRGHCPFSHPHMTFRARALSWSLSLGASSLSNKKERSWARGTWARRWGSATLFFWGPAGFARSITVFRFLCRMIASHLISVICLCGRKSFIDVQSLSPHSPLCSFARVCWFVLYLAPEGEGHVGRKAYIRPLHVDRMSSQRVGCM